MLQTQMPVGWVALVVYFSALFCATKLLQLIASRRRAVRQFQKAKVPLAPGWRLISGHVNSVILRDDNIARMEALHQQLGPNFGLIYGPDSWIMTTDVELVRRVFITEGNAHVDHTELRLPFFSEWNESLVAVQGDRWRKTRRLIGPSLTPKQINSDNVHRDIDQMCSMVTQLIEENLAQNCKELDVNYAFKRYSSEVISRVGFGYARIDRFDANESDELIELVDEVAQMATNTFVRMAVMLGPQVRYVMSKCARFTALNTRFRRIHGLLDSSLATRRAIMKEAVDRNGHKLIDSLIESCTAGKMADSALKANLFFLMVAGFETSANTLTLMFWLLAKHQDKQERLRAELRQSGGSSAAYLDWVVHETLRLYPAAPLPVGRVLEHDIEHEGHLLSRGMTVVASIHSIHRCRAYWGEDVDAFRPERFDPSDQQPAVDHRAALHFLAFGAGPRYCIGQHLALAEIKALAAQVLTRFRVELSPGITQEPELVSPNMVHFIVKNPIVLKFSESSDRNTSADPLSVASP